MSSATESAGGAGASGAAPPSAGGAGDAAELLADVTAALGRITRGEDPDWKDNARNWYYLTAFDGEVYVPQGGTAEDAKFLVSIGYGRNPSNLDVKMGYNCFKGSVPSTWSKRLYSNDKYKHHGSAFVHQLKLNEAGTDFVDADADPVVNARYNSLINAAVERYRLAYTAAAAGGAGAGARTD
jgi:hypothetical protein